MANYAQVIDGVVHNVYRGVSRAALAKIDHMLIECDASVQPNWVMKDGAPVDPETLKKPVSHLVKRRNAYHAELRDDAEDDELAIIGKILDILVAQVASTVPAGSRTPQFVALLAKIAEIKSRYPAP